MTPSPDGTIRPALYDLRRERRKKVSTPQATGRPVTARAEPPAKPDFSSGVRTNVGAAVAAASRHEWIDRELEVEHYGSLAD